MKILLIGYGSIGKRHVEVLEKYFTCEIHIVSSQQDLRHMTFSSINEVTNIAIYDYFIIATPTSRHIYDVLLLDSLVSNKTILVEKPLFSNEVEFFSQNNNHFFVAYVLRYHPLILKLKDIIKENNFPYFVQIICESYLPNWRLGVDYRKNYSAIKELGGGVLFDLSHEVDYAEWLFGRFKKIIGINKKISELEITSDDIGNFIIETENNINVNLLINYFSKKIKRKITIYTKTSNYVLNLVENTLETININGEIVKERISLERNDLFKIMHEDILKKDKNKILPNIQESKNTMKTLMRMKNMDIERNNICIIGCRAGSKGVKNKNIRDIAGKPLIAHTIEQALKSRLFKHVVLSTDSREIADIGKKWGAEVFFLRDSYMASDSAGKLQVVQDAVIRSEQYYREEYDVVVDLDVTSPLREVSDIINAYEQFIKDDNDILISASPSKKNPYFNMVEIEQNGNKNTVVLSKKLSNPILGRQDAPQCYDMNASIYIWKKNILFSSNTLFTDNTGLYVMPEDRSVDIDTELDFKFVEFLLQCGR
ncbi:hypothetical protein FGY55_06055 [Campylobacter coli]|nr:hypothetical protein [Campylobacter coli]EAK1359508.1 hypothetical protein [Campylobacter coli]EAW7551845.1 hypothetical protein [Campylobacter coli]